MCKLFYVLVVCDVRSTVGELKVDGVMLDPQSNGVPSCSEGLCNCSESGPGILGEGSEIHEEKNLLKGIVSGCMENQREMTNAGQYLNGHGRDKDMERALEHQAQLIGQYEAEEKAQREWEEKFRENNGSTPVCFIRTFLSYRNNSYAFTST